MNGAALDASLGQLRALIRRGAEIRGELAADARSPAALAGVRIWQRDCADAVSQLSGGSKAHWLSRAYSAALLVRAPDGGAVVEAGVDEIVARVVRVLEQAIGLLTAAGPVETAQTVDAPRRRFDFVHDPALRSVLDAAYIESARALEEGDFTGSLMTSCGAIEAMLTDALERGARQSSDSADQTAAMSFAERIAAAESRGLIRGGCGRLTEVARAYRALAPQDVVTARDARIARQVLHVVIRDLDPGR